MIACVDVGYLTNESIAACVGIRTWKDGTPCAERVMRTVGAASAYVPGQFFLRELPPILQILDVMTNIKTIVIDGYVWLARDRPGLGAHLYACLSERVPIIGVAKSSFHNNDCAVSVVRGKSSRALFVTAVGIDGCVAAECIARMDGQHRMPSILRRVDLLARGIRPPDRALDSPRRVCLRPFSHRSTEPS